MIESLQIDNLSCKRGGATILSEVTFGLGRGEVMLLRGPNGAGKTTLLRTIAGYLRAGGGAMRFRQPGGIELEATEQQEHLHFVGHLNAVKPRLTVIENVQFWRAYYSAPNAGPDATETALEAFALLGLADLPAAHLSAGQTRRLALARLLAVPRALWLLDEPTSSLDAASSTQLEQAVRDHARAGGMALIATHIDLDLPGARTLTLARPEPRGAA
jgi:heme exporter protein A